MAKLQPSFKSIIYIPSSKAHKPPCKIIYTLLTDRLIHCIVSPDFMTGYVRVNWEYNEWLLNDKALAQVDSRLDVVRQLHYILQCNINTKYILSMGSKLTHKTLINKRDATYKLMYERLNKLHPTKK